MEMLIREDPTAYFTERVALNLWYVYLSVYVLLGTTESCVAAAPLCVCSLTLCFALYNIMIHIIHSTLYELQCDSVVAARKKRVLQLLAKRFMLQDIGPESFRLQ
jgi:hypothetical protein